MKHKIIIYHNPQCSKSRQSLELLKSKGLEPEIIEYQKVGFTKHQLKDLLKKLNLSARDILRDHSEVFDEAPEEIILDMMVANPSVVQRPIIVKGEKAVIGRPPENILKLI